MKRSTLVRSAVADSTGLAVIDFGAVPTDRSWLVERIVVRAVSNKTPALWVYLTEREPQAVLDYTPDGSLAIAEYPGAGMFVPAGERLIFAWESLDAGDQVFARIQHTTEV